MAGGGDDPGAGDDRCPDGGTGAAPAAGSPGEFDGIARFFAPLTGGDPDALALRDDAAVLTPPPGRQIVVTVDAIIAGVHFLPDDPPDLVARKLMRVNLSDLAAMGAVPFGYVVTLALPAVARRAAWLEPFAAGLAADQARFGGRLLGGDTTGTPGALSLSLTAIGTVVPGRALRRDRARPGDGIYVSGSLGDSAIGLRLLRQRMTGLAPDAAAFLAARYRLPQPRLALGQALAALDPAGRIAAMDISDGLSGDLPHICAASGVSARVAWQRLPVSPAARSALAADPTLPAGLAASGGDDYELLFCAPPALDSAIRSIAADCDTAVTRIGAIEPAGPSGPAVQIHDGDGRTVAVAPGFRHF